MDEEQDIQNRKSGGWVVVVFLLLLVGYPASIGPVEAWLLRGRLPLSVVPGLQAFDTPRSW